MLKRRASSTVAALMLLILIAGCSSVKPLEIKVTPLKQVPLTLPQVDKLVLEPIEWWIINEENAASVWKELEKKGYDSVIFGVTDKGYEAMTVNNAKILELAKQQKTIIGAYKAYHDSQTKAINQHNKEQKEEAERIKKDESNKATGMAGFVRTLRLW